MKVKLLKKIRKQYSIVYFAKGYPVYGLGVYESDIYHVYDNKLKSYGSFKSSKEECIEWIINEVIINYNNKPSYKGIKVWHNA